MGLEVGVEEEAPGGGPVPGDLHVSPVPDLGGLGEEVEDELGWTGDCRRWGIRSKKFKNINS